MHTEEARVCAMGELMSFHLTFKSKCSIALGALQVFMLVFVLMSHQRHWVVEGPTARGTVQYVVGGLMMSG